MGKKYLARTAAVLGMLLLWILIFLIGAITIVFRGPSVAARDLLVTTVMETSAAKFVARLYFSQEEIDRILLQNTVVDSGAVTDSSLIGIPETTDSPAKPSAPLEIVDVVGATFKGKMMIIADPSRVYVASPAAFGTEAGGMRVEEMIKRDGATAGVNGGGFKDENGVGNGSEPIGLVIEKGQLVFGVPQTHATVIGFNQQNKLVVGRMTAAEALARGVRDAVSFDPVGVLVVNGAAAEISGTGGGLNPRTAIGQRADGAVLLLVIDGRQAHSIGASYKDLIDVMLRFGAVNAANLDGGSSSLMIHNDQIITVCASLYGSRKLPTAILVK